MSTASTYFYYRVDGAQLSSPDLPLLGTHHGYYILRIDENPNSYINPRQSCVFWYHVRTELCAL